MATVTPTPARIPTWRFFRGGLFLGRVCADGAPPFDPRVDCVEICTGAEWCRRDRLTIQTATPAPTSPAMTAMTIDVLARCGRRRLDVAGRCPRAFDREVAGAAAADVEFVEAAPPLGQSLRRATVVSGLSAPAPASNVSSKSIVFPRSTPPDLRGAYRNSAKYQGDWSRGPPVTRYSL
jgi:hypothetical protein